MSAPHPVRAVRVTARVRDALLDAAARGADERCGLLFGPASDADLADEWVELPNRCAAPDAYALDPGAIVAAADARRAGGSTLRGTWHTHPDGTTRASAADRATCRDGWLVVIAAGGALAAYAPPDGARAALTLAPDPA